MAIEVDKLPYNSEVTDEGAFAAYLEGEPGAEHTDPNYWDTIISRESFRVWRIMDAVHRHDQNATRAAMGQWIEVVQHHRSALDDVDRFPTWLFGVARLILTTSQDRPSRAGRTPQKFVPEISLTGTTDADSVPDSTELHAVIAEVLTWLDVPDQVILELYREGFTDVDAILPILGISDRSSETAVTRFLERAENMVTALTLFRLNTSPCPRMRALRAKYLSEDGVSPQRRRAIARHVHRCPVCRKAALALLGPQGALGTLRLVNAFSALTPPDDVIENIRHALARPPRPDRNGGWRRGWPPPMVVPRWSADGLWGDHWSRKVIGWVPRHPVMAAVGTLVILVIIGIGLPFLFSNDVGPALSSGPSGNDQSDGSGSSDGSGPRDGAGSGVQPGAPGQDPVGPRDNNVDSGLLHVGVDVLRYENSPVPVVRRTIPISNRGGRPVGFEVQDTPGWLVVTPANGSLLSGQSRDLIVELLRAQREPGPFTHTLQIRPRDGGGGGDVRAIGEIGTTPLGQLQVRTERVDFGESALHRGIQLANVGNAPVGFALSGMPPWLRVTPQSGRLEPSQQQAVDVELLRTTAPKGPINRSLNVTARDGVGGGTVAVLGRVADSHTPVGVLQVLTPELNLGNADTSADIAIRNVGDAEVGYTIIAKPAWLDSTRSSGTLAPGQAGTIPVTVDRAALPSGPFNGSVTVGARAGEGGGNVSVRGSKPTPGNIIVYPEMINFGSTAIEGFFTAENTGESPVSYTLSELPSWLRVRFPDTEVPLIPGEIRNLYVVLDRQAAPEGPISARITVTATNGMGGGAVGITGTVDRPAVISDLTAQLDCSGESHSVVVVAATITDNTSQPVLTVSSNPNNGNRSELTQSSPPTWRWEIFIAGATRGSLSFTVSVDGITSKTELPNDCFSDNPPSPSRPPLR